MFQSLWNFDRRSSACEVDTSGPSATGSLISRKALIHWEEHCVECSVPSCYAQCPKYVRRVDGKCARFVEGITVTENASGETVADVQIRPWGKLEAYIPSRPRMIDAGRVRTIDRFVNAIEQKVGRLSVGLSRLSPKFRLSGALALLLRRIPILVGGKNARTAEFDGLYIEYQRFDQSGEPLHIEADGLFHEILPNEGGRQSKLIPQAALSGAPGTSLCLKMCNFSEDVLTVRFYHADLVQFAEVPAAPAQPQQSPNANAERYDFVKCVVFDLDNTFWQGVIGDDGPENIVVNDKVVDAVKILDSRGILCSIASKNDYETAFQKIADLGLAEYFLYPQIGWGAKSHSIKRIAEELNIGVDSLAFIDDSEFERGEVEFVHPSVRIYDETVIDGMLDLPEFNPPITPLSSSRRSSYLAEQRRKTARNNEHVSNDDFLVACGLQMSIHKPEHHRDRCFELLARTNQYNISGNKYTVGDFDALLAEKTCVCVGVNDKFGDYGIVAFAALDLCNDKIVLSEFVMSCRVAEKRVEETLIAYMSDVLGLETEFHVSFSKTAKNAPIERKLQDIGFAENRADGAPESPLQILSLDLRSVDLDFNIYEITSEEGVFIDIKADHQR